jgi:hypothetical protein
MNQLKAGGSQEFAPRSATRGPVGLTEVCVEAVLMARRTCWAPRSARALSSATNAFKAA